MWKGINKFLQKKRGAYMDGSYTKLRFKLGGLVTIDTTPFILLSTRVELPYCDDYQIVAVGKLVIEGIDVTRIYLKGSKDLYPFLQIIEKGDSIEEVLWLTPILEDSPEDEDDWEKWIHPRLGIMSQPEIDLPDGNHFSERAWSSSSNPTPPLEYRELVTIDPEVAAAAGTEETETILNQGMLYVEEVPGLDVKDLVLLQAEDGEIVYTYRGTELNPQAITVT